MPVTHFSYISHDGLELAICNTADDFLCHAIDKVTCETCLDILSTCDVHLGIETNGRVIDYSFIYARCGVEAESYAPPIVFPNGVMTPSWPIITHVDGAIPKTMADARRYITCKKCLELWLDLPPIATDIEVHELMF